jgi:hypothetical protein
MGLASLTGRESFTRLQQECNDIFVSYARKWGWHLIEMLDRPLHENLDNAREIIFKALPAASSMKAD